MAANVDAVIAALKVALAEAERSREYYWNVREANRWISELPGAWFGRWRNLRVEGSHGSTERADFIAQLRATLAYLEANRECIGAGSWFSGGKLKPAALVPSEPIDADFEEVARNVHTLPVVPPNKRNR
jgi:hypothetical protein